MALVLVLSYPTQVTLGWTDPRRTTTSTRSALQSSSTDQQNTKQSVHHRKKLAHERTHAHRFRACSTIASPAVWKACPDSEVSALVWVAVPRHAFLGHPHGLSSYIDTTYTYVHTPTSMQPHARGCAPQVLKDFIKQSLGSTVTANASDCDHASPC